MYNPNLLRLLVGGGELVLQALHGLALLLDTALVHLGGEGGG